MRRTGRPNAARSTKLTGAEPLDHTDPPQLPHTGRDQVQMCTAKGAPAPSSSPSTSTSPTNPNTHRRLTHTRVCTAREYYKRSGIQRVGPAGQVVMRNPDILRHPPANGSGKGLILPHRVTQLRQVLIFHLSNLRCACKSKMPL